MIPKFRLWHKSSKKMLFVDNVNNLYWAYFEDFGNKPFYTCIERIPDSKGKREYDLNTIHVDFDEGILMQSTGLLDKNGVEIFEGDILLITIFDNTVKGEVTYSEKDCAFMVDLIDRRYEETQYLGMFTSMQVIGNIYENPVEVEVGNENN